MARARVRGGILGVAVGVARAHVSSVAGSSRSYISLYLHCISLYLPYISRVERRGQVALRRRAQAEQPRRRVARQRPPQQLRQCAPGFR